MRTPPVSPASMMSAPSATLVLPMRPADALTLPETLPERVSVVTFVPEES